MIVLDSNVISELMSTDPNESILTWFDSEGPTEIYTTAINVAEVYRGIAILPEGKKRRELRAQAVAAFALIGGNVLVFDAECAMLYAEIAEIRKRIGRPISMPDAMIAAICRSVGARLATRNVRDFEEIGVPIVNPWEFAQGTSSGVR